MVEIRSREDLNDWLLRKPANWAQVIAARASMRALPSLCLVSQNWLIPHVITSFRTIFISWIAAAKPDLNFSSAARAAANASLKSVSTTSLIASATSSGGLSVNTIMDPVDSFSAAARSISSGTSTAVWCAAAATASSAVLDRNYDVDGWSPIQDECNWLLDNSDNYYASRILIEKPLWLSEKPDIFDIDWSILKDKLLSIDYTFNVWILWFEKRIIGENLSFYSSNEQLQEKDYYLSLRIAKATDEELWDKGPILVNNTLQSWIDEDHIGIIDSKVATLDSIRKNLLDSASPQAHIADGKLDAGSNALFDAPQYSDNLANLPSEMQAFLAVLEQTLPRNCPSIIQNCIKGYADELLARGNRPIVNVLTGMASAIAAQFWIIGDDADQQAPETWQVRHPDEWDVGTVDLFQTFFKKHIELITHFPLNAEREELIAATPIDEVRASGPALLEPIQAINDLILGLNKDGLATDNIVRIMDAHARYSRDIAGLPPPDQSMVGANTISPKRRHVLNTAGFYLHAYSVLGSTASLASSPQVMALMVSLAHGAQTMLGFIR